MTASSRRPTSRFQPGMAAMKAWTGASPSAFAIRGLPPERSFGFAATRLAAVRRVTFADFLGVGAMKASLGRVERAGQRSGARACGAGPSVRYVPRDRAVAAGHADQVREQRRPGAQRTEHRRDPDRVA